MSSRAWPRISRRRDWAFHSSVLFLRPNLAVTSFSALMRSPCHGWLGVSYLRRLNLGWPIYFLPPGAGLAGAAAAGLAAPAAAAGLAAPAGAFVSAFGAAALAPAAGAAASGAAAWPASLRWTPTAEPKRPLAFVRWPRVGSLRSWRWPRQLRIFLRRLRSSRSMMAISVPTRWVSSPDS